MNGTYSSIIKTPMGEVKGKISFQTKGNVLSGRIEALGMQSEFTNGTVNGNRCQFSGTIQTMFATITYQAEGIVTGNELMVKAKTNMGNFEFQGKKD